ncbi:MAG: hypothetical protein QOH82_1870, partial [Mycobacterium sp.]|nr:hypothetical protein [Mycobacterium sp.]
MRLPVAWKIAFEIAAGHTARADFPDPSDADRIEGEIGDVDEADVEIWSVGMCGQVVLTDELCGVHVIGHLLE